MQIIDKNSELISTKIIFFKKELDILDKILDDCDNEMEYMDSNSVYFTKDRLNRLTEKMTLACQRIYIFKIRLDHTFKSISN